MKISYDWLKDYVDIKLKPEELARKLTMAGLEVTSIEKSGSDSIMEFEITPNRSDCLSVIGIAREVMAVTGKKLKVSKSKLKAYSLKLKAKVEIKDKDLCHRYTARIIEAVKVGPSPKWLVDRLEKMGLKSVNNVVDITNFCLFELGQPLHAFDYGKIKGGKVIIRRAKKNEKIVTIDGDQRTLSNDMLVIADTKRPVAIGGVMGSSNSEVTDFTKNILLESAYFNPISIRRTSRRLGLISESSYRFERSVDLEGVAAASDRATSLIVQLCGGKPGPIKDTGKLIRRRKEISLRLARLKSILGLDISNPVVKKILTSLQLRVKSSTKGRLSVTVPSFRQDLKSEIDLVEEVARIYGYDKLPSTIPTMVGHPKRYEFERVVNNLIRETLISLGIDEIITYGLIARKLLEGIDVDPEKIVSIKNPLSLEQEIMRPTLLPGLLNAVSQNLNKRLKDQKIFELGKVYFKDRNSFREEDDLSIGIMGKPTTFWRGRRAVDFFDLKGILEALFERLGIREVSFEKVSLPLLSEENAVLKIDKDQIGFIGKPTKELLNKFDIDQDIFITELKLSKIIPFVKLDRRFTEIARYPSTRRDLSVAIDKNIVSGKVVFIVKNVGGALVKRVDLFDQYSGKQIPAGKKGLSYSIEYQAEDRTLTDKEVNKLHLEICNTLTRQLGAQIR